MLRHRKIIKRVLLFGVLGAIVNVAVAWAILFFAHRESTIIYLSKPPDYVLNSHSFFRKMRNDLGFVQIVCQGNGVTEEWTATYVPPAGIATPDPLHGGDDRIITRDDQGKIHAVGVALLASDEAVALRDGSTHLLYVMRTWVGKSFFSMGGTVTSEPVYDASGAPTNPIQWDVRSANYVCLPNLSRGLAFAPVWPGFAINTIFYAAILWAVFAVPGVVKRHRRRKRGLCRACAYPIGASVVCSECGAAVPARTKGAQECSHE
jgi:hypothetical protein